MAVGIKGFRPGGIRDRKASVILLATWLALVFQILQGNSPPDLAALYFAGYFFAEGHLSAVYDAATSAFAGTVSPDWSNAGSTLGYGDAMQVPYIYPPLWAALMAPVTDWLTPQQFFLAAYLVQLPLLALTSVLGWRLFGRPIPLALWLLASLVVFSVSIGAMFGLHNCQVHLTVGFLCLLAFERVRAKMPLVGGLCLALAASVKLFPALLAILWLATGERRALASFFGCGLALAGLSLALAGWPLHMEYLQRLAEFSGTINGVRINLSAQVPVYHLVETFGRVHAAPISGAATDPAMAKQFRTDASPWVSGIFALLLAAGLGGIGILARRAGPAASGLAVGAVLLLVILLWPLSWAYYLLPVYALLPILLCFFSIGRMMAFYAVFTLAQSFLVAETLRTLPGPVMYWQTAMVAGNMILLALFVTGLARQARRHG